MAAAHACATPARARVALRLARYFGRIYRGRMMTILVAGVPRSGSTWLFNAARLLAEARYTSVHAAWVGDLPAVLPADTDVLLVKLHEPDAGLLSRADKVLLSFRDLRDIAASSAAMGWADTPERLVERATSARAFHDFWAPHAAIDVRYDEIVSAPLTTCRAIAETLEWRFADEVLAELARAIPQNARVDGDAQYDPATLLHRRHVNDGRPGRWRDQLPPEVAGEIWRRHADWLGRHGYQP